MTDFDIKTDEPFTSNETLYHGFNTTVGTQIWSVVVTHGKFNSVIVKKISNNPFRGPGKSFDSFSDAFNHYKSSNMRNMLDQVKFQFEISNNITVD